MFAPRPSYSKLKTNLRLCINRLKLLEKKKTELSLKARREIADYISNGKCERAKIRVEHIIREDYLVEAMEIIEMFCDLLLARFGLIEQMKLMDEGLSEPISSIIWATPRLQTDVAEIKIISDQLTIKYGKQYTQCVLMNTVDTVNKKLIQKLSVAAPSKLLVEKYMMEIAKSHNVPYDPDPDVMREETVPAIDFLIDIDSDSDFKKFPPPDGGNFGAGGFICPPVPTEQPFNYPKIEQNLDNSMGPPPYSSMLPEGHKSTFNVAPPPDPHYPYIPPTNTAEEKSSLENSQVQNPNWDQYQKLPSVPTAPSQNESVDFDALTKRFEELKKRPL